jgi:hypothetical protein
MKLHRTAAFLAAGLAASAFIFFTSLFALHYDGEQPIGKTFKVILHDAYGAYINATHTNFTSIRSTYHFNTLTTELLDFTNSSQNWHLPSHSAFADFTSDISLDHLLRMFGGESEPQNETTAISIQPAQSALSPSMPVPTFEKVIEEEPVEPNVHFQHSPAEEEETRSASPNKQNKQNHRKQQIRHPAAPLDTFDPADQQPHSVIDKSEDGPMSCTRSYEPQCDMYPYVRFWNQRFYPEDCYESPLRPARKDKTPYDEQKYVLFEPDWGGWNNIRMGAEAVIIFAHATGRTLVMPPDMVFYLLNRNSKQDENQSTFHKFFDFRKIREGMNIISMEEFVENVAKKGLLKLPFPKDLLVTQKTKLYKYIEDSSFMRPWEPGKFFIGFNISRQNEGMFGTFERNKETQPRYKEMVAHGRALVPYDAQMDSERAIYFYGRYDTHRLLTHFYTYLYWEDAHTEQIYKRIVRDRLHYHDDIFCAAGKVVKLLHADAAALTGKPVQSAEAASPKTLGGDTNRDATYFAFHIRRGDFQYKDTRLSAEELWDNTRHLLDPTVTTLIYIATDERNQSFFKPFMKAPFTVKFLDSYAHSFMTNETNRNHVGMIEQVICANAHTFIGTARSTFTGYITRMRG